MKSTTLLLVIKYPAAIVLQVRIDPVLTNAHLASKEGMRTNQTRRFVKIANLDILQKSQVKQVVKIVRKVIIAQGKKHIGVTKDHILIKQINKLARLA